LCPSKAASGNVVGPPASARSATHSHPVTRNAATRVFLRLHKAAGFVPSEPQG
jgi:hypothetical protein